MRYAKPFLKLSASLAVLVALWPLAVSAQSVTTLDGVHNFDTVPASYISTATCTHEIFGGAGDSASMRLLAGGQCWFGPYTLPAGNMVGVNRSIYGGPTSVTIHVIRQSDNASIAQHTSNPDGSSGAVYFPDSVGVTGFYIMFEHISGSATHIDNYAVYAQPLATPTPTHTPVPTSTPVPSSTPVPTSTSVPATVTPVPTATPIPTATPVPTATSVPWSAWVLPPADLFEPVEQMQRDVVGREPFATIRRFQDQRYELEARLQSPSGFDMSRYESGTQAGFAFVLDFLSPLRPYIQIIFDAFVVAMFWQYITKRITT